MAKVHYVPTGTLSLPEYLPQTQFGPIFNALGMAKHPSLEPPEEYNMTLWEALRCGLCYKDGTPVNSRSTDWKWDGGTGRLESTKGFGEVGVLIVAKKDASGKLYASHDSHYIHEGPLVLTSSDDPTSTKNLPQMMGVKERAPSLSIATVEFVGDTPYLHVRLQWRAFMQQYALTLAGGYSKPKLTFREAVETETKEEIGGKLVRIINDPDDAGRGIATEKVWLNRARNVDGIKIPIVIIRRVEELPPMTPPEEDEAFLDIRIAIPLMDLDHVLLPDNYCNAAKELAIGMFVRGKLPAF